jgi:hypothetical protein
MKELNNLIQAQNLYRNLFNQTPLELSDWQEIQEIIESQLSPENLHADGERSATEVRVRSRSLKLALKQLRGLE